MIERTTQIIAGFNPGTDGKLPKCFYTLAAALAGIEAVYGKEMPIPCAGMLGNAIEAATLCVNEYAKTPEQREAEEGLDLSGYPGKWKHAQEYVHEHEVERGRDGYWDAVRTCFLELGGGLLSQKCAPAPIDWSADPARAAMPRLAIIPVPPYTGPAGNPRQG